MSGVIMELELQQWPDLFDALSEVGPMSEFHVKYIVAQLVEVASLCQTLGFVHRDIKLSNICFPLEQNSGLCLTIKQLFESKTDFVRIKLTDFGMAGMCFVSDKCHNSLL